jgi:hypothetical protein
MAAMKSVYVRVADRGGAMKPQRGGGQIQPQLVCSA